MNNCLSQVQIRNDECLCYDEAVAYSRINELGDRNLEEDRRILPVIEQGAYHT